VGAQGICHVSAVQRSPGVTALDVSLSFSYSNLALPNHYHFANPTIRNW
jgi:hypothetical protein